MGEGEEGSKVGREGIEKMEVKSSSSVSHDLCNHFSSPLFNLLSDNPSVDGPLPLRNPILGPTSSSLFEPKCLSFLNTSLKRREPLTLRKWVVQGRTSCYGTYFYLPTYKLQNKKKVFLYSIRNPD